MRGKKAKINKIAPDFKFGSVTVSRFINKLMFDGKKTTSERQVYKALDKLAEITGLPALEAFEKAVDNIKPRVEVKAKRVGGANYQVPTPVREARQYALAYRWIIASARDKRTNTEFYVVLADELAEAFKGQGNSIKKRDEMHRMADANKAFAHLAW